MAEEKEKELREEKEEFEKVFAILERLLLGSGVNIYIWEQLHPTEKVVATLNQYKGFFVHTRSAHVDGFILKVSDILSNSATAPSFYRILNMIGMNESLAPGLNGGEIKKRLRKHKEVLEATKEWRNKRVAHWDTSVDKLEKSVFLGPAKKMLAELQGISNKISASHSGGKIHAFRYLEQGDINRLLEALKRKRDLDKKLIEYLKSNKECQDVILSLMNVGGF